MEALLVSRHGGQRRGAIGVGVGAQAVTAHGVGACPRVHAGAHAHAQAGRCALAQALARATGEVYGFVDGRIAFFIVASLLTTLAVRLVLPVTAGMLTSAIILLPVAAAQGINPWICVFCAAVFSDISFFRHQGTNGIMQIRAAGLFELGDERGFLRYNMWMNLARVVFVFTSIPWWQWLGLL